MADNQKQDRPYGGCLLARDNPENRGLFPDGPFGNVAVEETICPSPDQCPHYHYPDDNPSVNEQAALETPIHLLIASYRDVLCGRTLHNAFQHAKNPKRLFFRVIQQTQADSGLDDDVDCWDHYCSKYNPDCAEYKDQVRIVPVDAAESKGPTWARSKLSAMVWYDYVHRHEQEQLDFHPVEMQDFCMQIDSHMDFSDNFDVDLIDMFHLTENDYAVLSTYVTDIAENNKDPKNVPNLCMVTFTSSIRNWGTKECRNLVKPKLTNAMWGAGLSFHRCHAELNVPVDPYLDNVFDGEEGSRGIRFFSHGYDVYAPHRVLVTHDYHGHQSNPVVHTWGHGKNKDAIVQESHWKFMEEIDNARSGVSVFGSKRVNLILGIGEEQPDKAAETQLARKSRYGFGNKRTLEQAIEFTGINLRERKMEVNKCGNLEWVPYEESPNYGVEETLSRSYAGEVATPFKIDASESTSDHEMLQQMNTSPKHIRFMEGHHLPHVPQHSRGIDYGLMGGFFCAALVVVVRFSTRKKAKNDKHKN